MADQRLSEHDLCPDDLLTEQESVLKGEVRLDPFLHPVLVEEWERLGFPFQMFLAEQRLASHMWLVAHRHA